MHGVHDVYADPSVIYRLICEALTSGPSPLRTHHPEAPMLYPHLTAAQLRLLTRATLGTLTVTAVLIGPDTATATPTAETRPLVESCSHPNLNGSPSADLLQGSIDNCRRAVADTTAYRAACLGILSDASRSPDVLQGWIDGCRLQDGIAP